MQEANICKPAVKQQQASAHVYLPVLGQNLS